MITITESSPISRSYTNGPTYCISKAIAKPL